jgi:hypothetical protein
MRGRTPGAKNVVIWNDRGERRCSKCLVYKPVSEYYRTRGYVDSRCKVCHTVEQAIRRKPIKQEATEAEEQLIVTTRLGPPPTGLAPYHESDYERFVVMNSAWEYFMGGSNATH